MESYLKPTEQQTLAFITFCTEMYAGKKNVSDSEVAKMFCDSGVFDFLQENYIELHTQGREFLIRAEGFMPRRLRRNKGHETRLRYLMRTTYLDASIEVC